MNSRNTSCPLIMISTANFDYAVFMWNLSSRPKTRPKNNLHYQAKAHCDFYNLIFDIFLFRKFGNSGNRQMSDLRALIGAYQISRDHQILQSKPIFLSRDRRIRISNGGTWKQWKKITWQLTCGWQSDMFTFFCYFLFISLLLNHL